MALCEAANMFLVLSKYLLLNVCHVVRICLDYGLYAEVIGKNDAPHPLLPSLCSFGFRVVFEARAIGGREFIPHSLVLCHSRDYGLPNSATILVSANPLLECQSGKMVVLPTQQSASAIAARVFVDNRVAGRAQQNQVFE